MQLLYHAGAARWTSGCSVSQTVKHRLRCVSCNGYTAARVVEVRPPHKCRRSEGPTEIQTLTYLFIFSTCHLRFPAQVTDKLLARDSGQATAFVGMLGVNVLLCLEVCAHHLKSPSRGQMYSFEKLGAGKTCYGTFYI